MFRSKTVFILGAGASAEVGLPIGEELKGRIAQKIDIGFEYGVKQCSGDPIITQALRKHAKLDNGDGNINPYLESAWRLKAALPQAISIDNLLEAYQDDERAQICGKLGIVSSILEAERASQIYIDPMSREKINFSSLNRTWFAGFIKILFEGISTSNLDNLFNNISFLSFNYDRCIEHYIYESIQNYYSINSPDAAALMKNIKILHPYGSVGKLQWDGSNQSLQVPFGSDRCDLLALSDQIKTFNERIHDAEVIKEIRELIARAEIIVFLDFAFHRQNLELIKPYAECGVKKVLATALGISKSDCNVIKDELLGMLGDNFLIEYLPKPSVEIRFNLKCADLFNEYWRTLTTEVH